MAKAETGWTKEFPPLSGFYWMRGFRQYRTLPVEVNGNKFGMMYGNGVLFDATDAEGAEFLGPLSPADAEQLHELRRAAQSALGWIDELLHGRQLTEQGDTVTARLRSVLNPKPEKETQGK